jgi:tetratricopeptide (TPR) repeat protein
MQLSLQETYLKTKFRQRRPKARPRQRSLFTDIFGVTNLFTHIRFGNMSRIPRENFHLHDMNLDNPEQRVALMVALSEGVAVNNEAGVLSQQGKFAQAVEKYERAIALKVRAHGEESVHVCISLSGLCDAYLGLGQLDKALEQGNRMLDIAKKINSPEQKRIAVEILVDVRKAMSSSKLI